MSLIIKVNEESNTSKQEIVHLCWRSKNDSKKESFINNFQKASAAL